MADGNSGTIVVFSDGSGLSRNAVSAVSRAAAGSRCAVEVRDVASASAQELAALGVSAVPAIAIEGQVVSLGCPTDAQSAVLVKKAEIDRVVMQWAVPRSEAMQLFASGKGPGDRVARAIATDFYAFCHEFPLFLAAAISHVRDEPARLLLVHNLYEEHGDLHLEGFHPALFRKYVSALGLQSSLDKAYEAGSPGFDAAQWVTEVCRRGPAHRALGALYVTEQLFGPACQMIMQGLRHLPLSAEETVFFEVHSAVEHEHAEQLLTSLMRVCANEAEWREAVGVAGDISRAFYSLFDYIARADFSTTPEEIRVYELVNQLCRGSANASRPIAYTDSAYCFGVHLAGEPQRWFVRALCDSERRSLVTRLSVEQARQLSPGFKVEPAPEIFGQSRILLDDVADVRKLEKTILAAYEQEVARAPGAAEAPVSIRDHLDYQA
jgi:pyrroloquinoline quinone (PQQ) biosynthesis protein C